MKRTCVVVLLFFACAAASAQTGDCASLTHQALELAGVNQSIDHLTAIMGTEEFMQQFRGHDTPEQFVTMFKPIVMKEFSPAILRHELQARVSARCNPDQMARAVERLQSPLVAKMLALEAATNTPEGQEKLKKYINIAKTVPPTDDRMDDIDALDSSAGASDLVTDTVVAILRGMMTGVGAPPDVIAQFEAHRKDIKAEMQNNIELSMRVTYHGVTRPELQQYAREVGSPPLKGFYTLVNKTFVEIIEERSLATGQDLKKAIEARKN